MLEKNADGTDKIPNPPVDPFEALKGQVDDAGIPKHPEERAEYYKTKFSESSRGAQELLTKNQTLAKENEDLKKPKFTQEELSSLIPGYDKLAPEQQKAIFESWSNTQRELDSLKSDVAAITDRQVFEDGFKNLVKIEEFSILKKHKSAFKDYAYSDAYRAIDDLSVIARSYIMEKKLYDATPKDPADQPAPKDAGNPGLDSSRGGKPAAPAGTYTLEEAAALRKDNPREYNRLAAAGKLKIKEE